MVKSWTPETALKQGDEIVRIDNVVLRYQDSEAAPAILSNASLSIAHGSFHFLTGQSGAGKSSLLKLIHLSLKPTEGAVQLLL